MVQFGVIYCIFYFKNLTLFEYFEHYEHLEQVWQV